jgi:hypothetical protein
MSTTGLPRRTVLEKYGNIVTWKPEYLADAYLYLPDFKHQGLEDMYRLIYCGDFFQGVCLAHYLKTYRSIAITPEIATTMMEKIGTGDDVSEILLRFCAEHGGTIPIYYVSMLRTGRFERLNRPLTNQEADRYRGMLFASHFQVEGLTD